MRFFFRRFFLPFYRRWALWYIRRERVFRYGGLRLRVPPGVFHPGVFFSTPIFLSFLQKIDLQGKTVIDVGTGSGALALFAARRGARVTALDVNPLAVATARDNARDNGLEVAVMESDLFDRVPAQAFDYVLINPPYYPRSPRDTAESAFFAGENLEYFEKLFRQLPGCLHSSDDLESSDESPPNLHSSDDLESSDELPEKPNFHSSDDLESSDELQAHSSDDLESSDESQAWIILSEDCDLETIRAIATRSGFRIDVVHEKKKWGERFLLFALTRNPLTR